MKKKFLDYAMQQIQTNNTYDEIKLEELRYGLETFYMLVTKLLVSILIAIILGIFKEFVLFLIFYTPLRSLGFGFHAKNSLECWIISIPLFILIPLGIKYLNFNLLLIQICLILSTISFLFFAPADTKNKPLINSKKRLLNKSILVIVSIIYLIITIFIKQNLVLNAIFFASIWQAICVNPLTYKLFGQPFNNYKTYLTEV